MVIFHSYVKLPEGNTKENQPKCGFHVVSSSCWLVVNTPYLPKLVFGRVTDLRDVEACHAGPQSREIRSQCFATASQPRMLARRAQQNLAATFGFQTSNSGAAPEAWKARARQLNVGLQYSVFTIPRTRAISPGKSKYMAVYSGAWVCPKTGYLKIQWSTFSRSRAESGRPGQHLLLHSYVSPNDVTLVSDSCGIRFRYVWNSQSHAKSVIYPILIQLHPRLIRSLAIQVQFAIVLCPLFSIYAHV